MLHTMTTRLRLGGQPKVSRRPVSEQRLPDFLIIGACASTPGAEFTERPDAEFLTSSSFGRRVAKGYKPSLLLPETRQRLLKLFEEPNTQLAEFLGRDLSHWNA